MGRGWFTRNLPEPRAVVCGYGGENKKKKYGDTYRQDYSRILLFILSSNFDLSASHAIIKIIYNYYTYVNTNIDRKKVAA